MKNTCVRRDRDTLSIRLNLNTPLELTYRIIMRLLSSLTRNRLV